MHGLAYRVGVEDEFMSCVESNGTFSIRHSRISAASTARAAEIPWYPWGMAT